MSDDHDDHVTDFTHYRYGVMLAKHGIGLAEFGQDWPEAFKSPEVRRGYYETWRKRGFAQPPE
jgi:hypothetical protein